MLPRTILTTLVRGLLGRLLSYGALVLGFWLLFKGFSEPSIPVGFLGGAAIIGGMYFMVVTRRSARFSNATSPAANTIGGKEDDPGDSFDGSDQSDQLPPQ